MTSLLPSSFTLFYPNPTLIDLGGRNQHAALLYPMTHPSSVPLLQKRIRGHITNSIQATLGHITFKPELHDQIDELVKDCLGRLSVIRVKPRYRSWSLALKSLLRPLSLGDQGGMDLVVCDGFGDGFWPERWHDEQKNGRRKVSGLRGGEDVGMSDVMEDINKLRKEMGSVIVLSIQGLYVSLLRYRA
jgi:hypothetical protein